MCDSEQLAGYLRSKYRDLDTTGFNVWDLMHAKGSGLEALMYSKLFWPDFVEIDDMVILKDYLDGEEGIRRVREILEKNNRDRVSTEKSLNYVEVAYLFGPRRGEATDEADIWLAKLLRETWHARLRSLYPDRFFVVEVLDETREGGELYIVLYQQSQDVS